MTYLRLAKYIFGIGLLAQTFFQSMDLPCSKWKIGIKIDDFVFYTSLKYIFGIGLFVQPVLQPSYGFTVFPMENWPQICQVCIFYLHFAQIFTIFADFRASTIYLCLAKYILGIVLFSQLFVQSIYGVTVLQMEMWHQNL